MILVLKPLSLDLSSISCLTKGGLFIIVFPDGRKRWRFDYVFNKKRNTISLGAYPQVSLQEARQKKEAFRQSLQNGKNPSSKTLQNHKNTLENIAKMYFENRQDLSPKTIKDENAKLEKNIFPYLEKKDVSVIKPLKMTKLKVQKLYRLSSKRS